jgi:Sulfotransferase family
VLDYCTAGARLAERALVQRPRLKREERLVFVVGCPRSGTTFLGRGIGGLPGFVDLGEVTPWKATLPSGPSADELRGILERIRRIGLAWGLRGVEQTPETAHVLDAALEAYPEALAVHALRDGRDVVCSLLERGWFRADRGGVDDARHAYGAYPRFWVEAERADEFSRVSEARRAAWAWRRYVGAVRAVPDRVVELRYEALVAQPAVEAERLAAALRGDADALAASFERAHDTSVGRWRGDLTSEQVRDVEDEAGELLAELGYA